MYTKNNMEREEIRKMIPYGALKEVATLAGVTYQSVHRYFKHKQNSYKIEIAALTIAKKYNSIKQDLIESLAHD